MSRQRGECHVSNSLTYDGTLSDPDADLIGVYKLEGGLLVENTYHGVT